MAGHNKWSKIKRQKAVTDSRRSKAWARITRDIMVAARESGGDVGMNPRLALAVEKAKGENMPKDNIDRAIKRGTGEIQGADYVEIAYEGYAPGGIAVFVDALTDNTNRSVADIRSVFSKAGGSLGQSGSVAFQFDRKGVFEVPAGRYAEETLFLLVAEAGAENLELEDDAFVITTPVEAFGDVQHALEQNDVEIAESSLQRIPTTTTEVDAETARKVARLIEKLEELQDVQSVWTTMEFTEDTLEAIA